MKPLELEFELAIRYTGDLYESLMKLENTLTDELKAMDNDNKIVESQRKLAVITVNRVHQSMELLVDGYDTYCELINEKGDK